MRKKLIKMIAYLDLVDSSKEKEVNILISPFYKTFPDKIPEQAKEFFFQQKVTKKLKNRIKTLKLEL